MASKEFEEWMEETLDEYRTSWTVDRIRQLLEKVKPECRQRVIDAFQAEAVPASFDPTLGMGESIKTHQRSNGEEVLKALPEMLGKRKVKRPRRT